MKGGSLMKFGENLKLIRKSKKISQEELGELLGVSRQSVSKWETGENYPSMNNIMCLCDIFKCKINELVHEDFIDINFLDDEIKMSVVKFKENEQKKMKGLSKAIYIVARILKIASIIGMVSACLVLVASFIVIPNTKFNNDNYTITFFGKEYSYKLEDTKIKLDNDDNKNIVFTYTSDEKIEVEKFMNEGTFYQMSFIIILSISLLLSCFFMFKMLSSVEKLFMNIHNDDTPFNMDNTNYIKKIALYLALYIFIPDVFGTLVGLIFNLNLNVEIEMINYFFVAIVIALAYIFKYGYEIQLDSKGKIYGDENE